MDTQMETLQNDLLTNKYTIVQLSKDERGTPTYFSVYSLKDGAIDKEVSEVKFQSGAIKEVGVNGVMNEDVIVMAIARLESFQNSDFKCRENAVAITKLEEALMWLRKRTTSRENRGVEGTHQV